MNYMKVAYFLGGLNRGGFENLVCDICRRYGQTSYDFVCVYRHEGNMSETFKNTRAPMIHVAKNGGMLRYLLDIRRALRREHVTIVHSQTPQNTLLLSVALLGTGIQVMTTFHGYNFSKAPWWQRMIVYNTSEKIICVSEHQKSEYEQRWRLPNENKLEVVYNGIDFDKIDLAKPSSEFAEEPRKKRLAMVGNFVSGRSQNIIAKSVQVLKARGITDVDFYFIGKRIEVESELYDNCLKYCEENGLKNVHFLGSRGDVPEILKAIDGFVYSTVNDTFGIAVIEAIAAGLPVVVNDWPVMMEVCGVENAGIRYFQTGNVTDAADKIALLLSNLKDSKNAAKKNAELVHKRYSIEQHINQLNKIYQSL